MLQTRQIKRSILNLNKDFKRRENVFVTQHKKNEKKEGEKRIKAVIKLENEKKTFLTSLDKGFNISRKDLVQKINSDRKRSESAKKEDITFFQDQITTRSMFMSVKIDKAFSEKHLRADARKVAEAKKKEKGKG